MVEHASPKPLLVLLAEDNPTDVFFVREALARQKIEYELDVVEDGQDAISHLCSSGALPGRRLPDLILLDLNLPKYSGKEVLQRIRECPSLTGIPVVILTSSEFVGDREEARRLGACCYLTKPFGLEELIQVGAKLKELLQATRAGGRV